MGVPWRIPSHQDYYDLFFFLIQCICFCHLCIDNYFFTSEANRNACCPMIKHNTEWRPNKCSQANFIQKAFKYYGRCLTTTTAKVRHGFSSFKWFQVLTWFISDSLKLIGHRHTNYIGHSGSRHLWKYSSQTKIRSYLVLATRHIFVKMVYS